MRLVSHTQPVLQHDFHADPMCPVTVHLSFCNLLQSPVMLCIEAGRQADAPEAQTGWSTDLSPAPILASQHTTCVQSAGLLICWCMLFAMP